MAEKATPNVTVRDRTTGRGNKTKASVNLGAALLGNWSDKSDNLKKFIEEFSDGAVIHRSDVFSHGVTTLKAYGTGKYGTVKFKARCVFRDPVDDSIHTIQIPAPKENLFEERNGDMYVTAAKGVEIQNKLNSELGLGWQFISGELDNS